MHSRESLNFEKPIFSIIFHILQEKAIKSFGEVSFFIKTVAFSYLVSRHVSKFRHVAPEMEEIFNGSGHVLVWGQAKLWSSSHYWEGGRVTVLLSQLLTKWYFPIIKCFTQRLALPHINYAISAHLWNASRFHNNVGNLWFIDHSKT